MTSPAPLHLLLVRFSSLGDVVIQTSVISWLERTYGERLKISFVTAVEFKDLLEHHPRVSRVLTFDRKRGEDLSSLVQKIKALDDAHPIDLVLDLHATTRSWLLRLRLWWLPRLVVDKRRFERLLLVRWWGKKFWTGLSRPWQQVWRTPSDWQGLLFAPLSKLEAMTFTSEGAPVDVPKRYLVLAPVASFATKRWPIAYYRDVAQRFLASFPDWDVVVIAGPEDVHCQELDALQHPRFRNLQGKTKLRESIAWMQQASLVLGNDSGMNHVAEAAGVPVVTLFGPTHEAFGFGPHLENSQALSLDLWCRPCSTTGKKSCFRKEQFCMTLLTPEHVWPVLEAKARSR